MGWGTHALFMIQKMMGFRPVIDIRPPDSDELIETYTDLVRHTSEPDITTDVTMDDATVVPTEPVSQKVLVTPGLIQWYGHMITVGQTLESPEIAPHTGFDCDPTVAPNIRWAVLCIYRNLEGIPTLHWEYSDKPGEYPKIPHNMIPLCFVKQDVGLQNIYKGMMRNWRTIHPTYGPSVEFLYPPVFEDKDLENHTNVPDGAMSFVISAGMWYFYYNGTWSPTKMASFDNTLHTYDVPDYTSVTELPWPVLSYAEIIVFRDGLVMRPGDKFDYTLVAGPGAYLQWNYELAPNMRIMIYRNPFLGASYSPDNKIDSYETYDLWVDGVDGFDAFPGTEDAPFKTLQKAFDTIPYSSKHAYVVHVRRLQLADSFKYEPRNNRTYGVLNARQLRSITMLVEENCDYNTIELDSLYLMVDVSSVLQVDTVIPYPTQYVDSYGFFSHIIPKASLWFVGGQHYIYETEMLQNIIWIDELAMVRMYKCKLRHVQVRYAGLALIENTTVEGITGIQEGLIHADDSVITGSIYTENSNVILNSCILSGSTGSYNNNSFVVANKVMAVGDIENFIPTPFRIQLGSSLRMSSSEIAYTNGPGVRIQFNSTAEIQGGSIHFAKSEAGIVVSHSSSLVASLGLKLTNNVSNGILLTFGSMGDVRNVEGDFNTNYGIYANMYSTCFRQTNTLNGNIAPYREDNAGSDTVAADGQDEYPSFLDRKLIPGLGLMSYTEEAPPPVGNRQMRIGIDVAQLVNPDGPLATVLNSRPRCAVYKHNQAVNPGDVVDVYHDYPGVGYLWAVQQRINNPQKRVRKTETNLTNSMFFVQMDSFIGTEFTAADWRLKDRPGLGYPVKSPYFLYSLSGSPASLHAYTIGIMESLTIDADVPAGTQIRCAVSVNGGKNFKRWDGSAWINLPGESVLPQLNNADIWTAVNAYPPLAWNTLKNNFPSMYFDIGFLLMTTDKYITPKLKSYSWAFIDEGFNLEIGENFRKVFYATRGVFTNVSSQTFDPPVYFIVYPLLDFRDGAW